MKIGLVGSGGREHALSRALARDRKRDALFVFGSHVNPGVEGLAQEICVGSLKDFGSVIDFFGARGVDLVVIGPEVPLTGGLVDELRARRIPAVGPTRLQARLEGDKAFMRDLLSRRVGWGSPRWKLVESPAAARQFIAEVGQVAVKPTGLTGGKGVRVMGVHLGSAEEAVEDAATWIRKDGSVLLEERLVGEEFSRMAYVADGKIAPMPVAQDFKYAFDGDTGNMTGGMGAYTAADGSLPFLSPTDLAQADLMLESVVQALEAETGQSYRGFLYGQFMATAGGVRVIEFNVRLGDPEGINAMTLACGDVPVLLAGLAQGHIDRDQAAFSPQAAVVKYLVPGDYPDNGPEPLHFHLDESRFEAAGVSVVYASVSRAGEAFQTLGSRTLALVGLGADPGEVSGRIEALLAENEPPALRHRMDVGDAEVIRRKVERMATLRAGGKQ